MRSRLDEEYGPSPSMMNVSPETDPPVFDVPEPEPKFTHLTDDRVASTRSKQEVASQEEFAARELRAPKPAEGLALRMAMAGQCENDQFPFTTDKYGKQIR